MIAIRREFYHAVFKAIVHRFKSENFISFQTLPEFYARFVPNPVKLVNEERDRCRKDANFLTPIRYMLHDNREM